MEGVGRGEEDEAARLHAVHRYQLLDTAPEGVYDDLTRLAAYICGTPISLLSLIDRDRQWFKSRHGLEVQETPRDISFCAVAIQSPETMVVGDATQDPRFSGNPLVEGEHHMRYYAGAPLVTPDGYRLGTLCVIDRQPRQLSPEQLEMLAALSRQAVTQMELRRRTGELEQAQRQLERANTDLERQVQLRTAELHKAVDSLLRQSKEASAADRALREREAELAQAQKVETIGRLAGGMAHDFNNLLTVVLGCAELAGDELPTGSPARADLQEIRRAASRAQELTSQLLSFTRRGAAEVLAVQVAPLLEDMRRLLRRVLRENIELRLDEQPDLWPVRMNPRRLEQVLINLAVNARDAMPDGGLLEIQARNLSLATELEAAHGRIPPGDYVLVSVRDTGTGMTADVLRRLFEPFFTTKAHGEGTGLGLPTSAWMLAQTGGHLTARSEPGHGSTFELYLPRHHGVGAAVDAVRPAPAPARGRERVLFVEDDAAIRAVACRVLRGQGYQVIEAASGGDALEALQREQGLVQLVVTDVVMPNMGGPELVKRLRARLPATKVVFTSGYAGLTSAELAPGTTFLAKPYTPEALLRAVRALLDAS